MAKNEKRDPDAAEYEPGVYDETRTGKGTKEPAALLRECPACGAAVGAWCGGRGDIHEERARP